MKKVNYIYLILITLIITFIISLFIVPINLNHTNPSTIIYDQNNIEIWEIINDNKTRHRFTDIKSIPEFSKKAIIAIEDKNFYNNSWIDFSAIIRAIYNNIKSYDTIEWASTISTQVIRNSYWLNKKRTYLRKISEFYLALALNSQYSKDEILEYYLNNIYFWYLNYWISSASKYYFDKDLNNLTKAEQLALLILPKNPSKYNPYNNELNFKNRFDKIADFLNKQWLLNNIELESIKAEILTFNYNHKNKLPYIVDFIKNKNSNNEQNIETTIDYNLTQKIDEIAKNTIIPLAWKDVWDYWVIITDRKTNNLKVMLGWVDYYLENWQVNSTTALRQPGSTIKPFTYLLAFKDLWYKPETTILDLPVQFYTTDWNTYNPKNYSLDYKWEVTIAEALSQSINIPAIKIVEQVWISRLLDFLKSLNITSLDKDIDYYWLALTLWVWEVSLYELLQAYSIFSNDWEFCNINITETKNKCKKIIDKKYTYMVYQILTNRYFKLAWFPINSNLDFENKEVFVKTWTSRNFRDNWSVGFTQNYMIWVWAWNKDGTYMKWVSWATWAWEIFRNIVDYLEKDNFDSEKIIYKNTWNSFLKITNPLDNSVYKTDKNKPDNIQEIKLEFDSNKDYEEYKWLINWKKIDSDFFSLREWNFEIKVELYKNFEVIWSEEVFVEVE